MVRVAADTTTSDHSSAPAVPAGTRRLPGLDSLRAFAILWVVLHHVQDGFSLRLDNPLLREFFKHGNAGVDLFFVLSGYLITGLLLGELKRTGSLSLGRFWYRRWMRTLPAYFVVLFVLAGFELLRGYQTGWPNFPSYLFFLQNYANDETSMRFVWSWSLCVEEWFYLLLPLLTVALHRLAGRPRPEVVLRWIAGAAVLASLGSRIWLYQLLREGVVGAGTFKWSIDLVTHYRLDGLAAGVLLATLPRPQAGCRLWPAVSVALVVLAVFSVTRNYTPLMAVFRPALLAVGFGTVVHALVGDNAWARLRIPGAGWVANLSYSLYLTHPLAEKAVRPFGEGHGLAFPIQLGLFLLLTLIFSLALRYVVERPLLWLRDHRHRYFSRARTE